MTLLSTAVLSLVLFAMSTFVLGAPLTPEEAHSWRAPLGTLCLFSAWTLSLVAWGELIRRPFRLAPSLLERLALGSLFYALLGGALGHLQLIALKFSYIFYGIAATGPLALAAWEWKKNTRFFLPPKPGRFSVAHLPLIFFCLLYFFHAAFPSADIDPLWLNLQGTRSWVNAGGIQFSPNNPLPVFSNAWNHLYLWAHLLLGGQGERGLITAQIFAQWTHVVLGGGIVALSLYRIFRAASEGNEFLSWIAVLAGMVAPALSGVLPIAASAWGAMAWVLFGFSLANQEKRYLSGCTVLGLGVAAQISQVFFAFPLILMLVVSHWQENSFRLLTKTLLGLFLGLSPLLLNNFFYSGHSLYTMWHEIIHGPGTKNALLYADQSVFIPLALVVPMIYWFLRRSWSRSGYFHLALWFGLLWFLLTLGTKADPLLLGAGLPLLAGFGVVSLGRLARIFQPNTMQSAGAFLAVALVIFLAARTPLAHLKHLGQLRNLATLVYAHPSGRAFAWVRNNVDPAVLVASIAEPRLYYLSGHNVLRVWDIPELDQGLRKSKTLVEGLELLAARGVHFILDTNDLAGVKAHRPFLEAFWAAANKHRAAIVFQTQDSRVLDLSQFLMRLRRR